MVSNAFRWSFAIRFIAVLGVASGWSAVVRGADRPNILWLIAEDFGNQLGCTGTKEVWTPNLDRLAATGVRYARFYTTAPVCSASRSAFMTGMYQTTIGAHHHRSHRDDGYQLPSGVRLLSEWFRDAGYFTANDRHLPPGLGFRGTAKTDWNFTPPIRPFDSDRWADLKFHQPFFAQLNFQETHRPFQAPKRAETARVELPPYEPDHPVTRADHAAYLDAASELDRKVGLVLKQLEEDGLADSTIVVFFGDNGQAHIRGKQFCYEEGLNVPLLVRWPVRFAAPAQFQPGSVDERLLSAIDLAPTMLALAGAAVPATMQGRIFLGPQAGPPRDYVFGARDRCDETPFRFRTVRDARYRYIRNFTPDRPFLQANKYKETSYPVWNLLKELHAAGKLNPVQERLCAPRMPPEELYDLASDPHEIDNLAGRIDHLATLTRLRKVLEDWIIETNDQGRTPEPPELIRSQGVTRAGTPPLAGYALPDLENPSARARDPLPARPNIVFILADDLGYGDLGCYGATRVRTPNLDRLAGAGMRFTSAYSPSAVCTPTRYALLTGQYAWRNPAADHILSGVAPLCIATERLTVPALLKQAGYVTGVVGKWHLGLTRKVPDYNGLLAPGPREVGFDFSFIIPATGDRTPCVFVENGRVAGYDPNDPISVSYDSPVGNEPTGAKHPELLKVRPSHGHDNTIINGISRIGFMSGGKAARWMDEETADVLTRKAVHFIEANHDRPFFLYFATHDIHVPRVPHPRFRGRSPHDTRGDVIEELDWCVGEVLAALDRHHLAERTLVLFSSDNGGVMDDGYQDGSGTDTSGHRCNGPLRGYKGGLYEGGTRVPLIARWPGKIPAGKTSSSLVSLVDLMATSAALVGRDLGAPDGPDSINQLPALLSEEPDPPCRQSLVIHAQGARLAIRQGPWKLIPRAEPARAELFNLDSDLAEEHNLAARNPEKVNELTELLQRIRAAGRSRPARR
jgi:arylsulfatase A-like enzyme